MYVGCRDHYKGVKIESVVPLMLVCERNNLVWESQKVSRRNWDTFEDTIRRQWDSRSATVASKK
jgi:hypothetical protein